MKFYLVEFTTSRQEQFQGWITEELLDIFHQIFHWIIRGICLPEGKYKRNLFSMSIIISPSFITIHCKQQVVTIHNINIRYQLSLCHCNYFQYEPLYEKQQLKDQNAFKFFKFNAYGVVQGLSRKKLILSCISLNTFVFIYIYKKTRTINESDEKLLHPIYMPSLLFQE